MIDLNETQKKALEVSKTIKEIMSNRISTPKIYNVVHVNGHYAFKIGFIAYNYFSTIFQYEIDMNDCYIECGKNDCISLVEDRHCYSDTDLVNIFNEVMIELELRIPDKFLTAKGWK